MTESRPKTLGFACQQCRASKRRCDGVEPQCSYCMKTDKNCVYTKEPKTRKRKYWDESYVKSLENQVQALLALHHQGTNISNTNNDLPSSSPGSSSHTGPHNHPSSEHASNERRSQDATESSQSLQAMEELSVMMWRTNLADGVTVNPEPGFRPADTTAVCPGRSPKLNTPRHISYYAHDPERVHHIANLFLDCINREHQFTQYETSEVFSTFPNHQPDMLFLHAAMLAAGATFENEPDSLILSDEFAELCESLVFTCFKHTPSIHIIQGLSILSWRSLALGHDHLGWTFLSMAAGMAVHLRLHVLALDEVASQSVQPSLDTVQAFWSFYMTDRTSISILGRNCILPWRRVNVPAIETFFPDGKGDLAQVSFAWQCKLWYMHDRNMDQIFSSSFENQSISDQVSVLISTHRNLSHFLKSIDERLEITRGRQPKPVLLFHMAYQMAILITMPPFLRLFASLKMEQTQLSQALSLVLRSITSAAASMVRLVQRYCDYYGYKRANPLLIHHILSASIVHLMNTTATSPSFRGHSTRMVRQSVRILEGLNPYWPSRCQKSTDTIRALAQRWKVGFALLQVEDSGQEYGHLSDYEPDQVDLHDDYVQPAENAWLNTLMFNATNEGRGDAFDIEFCVNPIGRDTEADKEHGFNISMVNIPTAEEDDIFGLSNFFRNFESYPGIF